MRIFIKVMKKNLVLKIDFALAKSCLLFLCVFGMHCVFADYQNSHINFTGNDEIVDDDYPMVTKVPQGFYNAGLVVGEGEWGDKIDVNELQGIAEDDKFYYLTNQWEIYKLSKTDIENVVAKRHLLKINRQLKDGFYRHFGGIDVYKGLIYVATTGRAHLLTKKRAVPIVIVFDTDLNFVKFGRFPESKQAGAAWTAINPVNGHLYSSYGGVVYEYDREFENGGQLRCLGEYRLEFRYADLTSEEWKDVVAQGGAFSDQGLFYYVLDLKHSQKNGSTGIHAFTLHDNEGDEIDLWGMNNRGEHKPFISVRYLGSRNDDRFWEMEDISVGRDSVGEYIDFLQLKNGREDDAKIVRYRLIYDIRKMLDKMREQLF